MAENQFTSTIDTLFRGMDQFVNTKTVVGEPVQVGDTIIVPLVDVTCGMAAGSFAEGCQAETAGRRRHERQNEPQRRAGDSGGRD